MASLSRPFVRLAARNFATTTTRTIPRQALRSAAATTTGRRFYSSQQSSSSSSSSSGLLYFGSAAAAAVAGGLGYWYYNNNDNTATTTKLASPTKADYQKVYNEIAQRLEEKDDYDDGSFGPVLLRLAWHASGTYDKATGTGGSNGATMRFKPESAHGANAGLVAARDFLEPVKAKFPWISYSDLWILGGVCAIQEMLGPLIPYRPGRVDRDVAACTPDGRLPDATQGSDHIRAIFYRMGFNDQEIVALSGAHALGRCHRDRSGFEGPWTFSPTVVTNEYFALLLNEKWQVKKWDGPMQYEDKTTQSLMMLPTDMALVRDKSFRQHVERYAKSSDEFFKDFSAVIVRLFELGVPFEAGTESQRFTLKPTGDEST